MPLDPRLLQIASLAGLLLYGCLWLDFEVRPGCAVVLLGTALATQALGTAGRRFDPRSALISGLSLCLLLRTNSLWLAAAAAGLAVGSKFVVRLGGKHLFNPTNFGLVAMMLLTGGRVWVSPGQWGNAAFFGFLMVCTGALVVTRAARADVTLAFLGSYLPLVFGRALWLGEPMTIPLHRLENGALLLFAFFMISDPRTTPDARPARLLFAALVAFAGWYIQFQLYRTNGLLWSLAGGALLVPLFDFLLPAPRHQWPPATPAQPKLQLAPL